MAQAENKLKRRLSGIVTAAGSKHSLTVRVTSVIKHSLGKYVKRYMTIHVHDPQSLASVGDEVLIEEGRPVSKTKSWHLISIERAVRHHQGDHS